MNRQDIINSVEWRELFETLPVVQGFFGGDPDSHGFNALMQGLAVYIEKSCSPTWTRGSPLSGTTSGSTPS